MLQPLLHHRYPRLIPGSAHNVRHRRYRTVARHGRRRQRAYLRTHKEELRAGKNVRNALADGYSNAFSAIFDSNLTSVITGVILLLFGTGPIKGFATTLIIGLICSFFTAVYLSRLFFFLVRKEQIFQQAHICHRRIPQDARKSRINFLGQRKITLLDRRLVRSYRSHLLFARGLKPGHRLLRVDATTLSNSEKPVSTTELQQVLAPQFPDASVAVITIESSNQVRVSTNYKIQAEFDGPETEKEITGKPYESLKPYLPRRHDT